MKFLIENFFNFPRKMRILFSGGAVFLIVLSLILLWSGVLNPWEKKAYDFFLQLRGKRAVQDKIVVVGVDDSTFKMMNRSWPWDREVFARVVENIGKQAPSVIALDFIFSGAGKSVAGDRIFEKTLKQWGDKTDIVLGMAFYQNSQTTRIEGKENIWLDEGVDLPKKEFRKNASQGFLNMPTDSDGYIRRTALTRKSGERRYYSLAFQVFLKEQGLSPESVRVEPNQELQISGYPPIPLDEKNTVLINFAGGPGVFPGVSFYQAYQNMIPEVFFKDKIVLIGPEFTGSKDFYWTSFVNRSLGEKMAGVEIHAHIVDMLLGKQWIEKLSLPFQSLVLLLLDVILVFVFLILPRKRNFILTWAGVFIVFIFSSYFLLSAGNLFLPPVLVLWNLVFFLLLFIFLNQAAEIFTKKKLVEELEKQMEATREGKREVSERFMQEHEISPREKEIIDLVLAGKTNAQIAKKLFISVNTVKRHVYNIYQKTRVKSRVEFVKKFK